MSPAELTTTIERLIDDELTVAEERALLAYIEANPEHWRACALAFVEHRALARGARSWLLQSSTNVERAPLAATIAAALNGVVAATAVDTVPCAAAARSQAPAWEREPRVDIERAPARPTPQVGTAAPINSAQQNSAQRNNSAQRDRPSQMLSIAAGLAVAFALGGTIREYWPGSDAPPPSVAHNLKPKTLDPSGTDPKTSAAGETQFASTPVPENIRLHMVSNGGAPEQTVDVPLVAVDRVDENLLRSWQQTETQAALPPDILAQLRKEGHEVRQQKSWLQVELPDGRRALVPIERVIVRPNTQ